MLCTATFPLSLPVTKEARFIENEAKIFSPFSKRVSPSAVDLGEAAQLSELLRELWDFR